MSLLVTVNDGEWSKVRRNFQRLGGPLFGPSAETTFASVTITGLTASEFVMTDADKKLVSLAVPILVNKGGTGLVTITNHGLMLGSGTDAITALGAATNGQLPIGSTGADPVLATLTGTANQVTVTNAAGTITLSLSASLSLPGGVGIGGDIIPDTDNFYDIGSYDAGVEAERKDYYNTGDNGLFGIIDSQYWKGQTFTAGSNYDIASVKLLMYKGAGASPGTVTVSIRATTGTFGSRIPTGGDLAVGTIDGNDLTEDTDGEWIRITFVETYSLVSGTEYAICVRCAGTNPNVIYLREDSDAGYTNGNQCTSSDSGSSWVGGGSDDCMFETYSEGSEAEGFRFQDIYLSGDITDGTNATSAAEIAAAYAHISESGASHTYIDQDVTTTGNPQFTTIELGNATDTTIARVSAGVISVEGVNVMLQGDAPTAHLHDGDTLQNDGINSDAGGGFSFTTAAATTFNQSIILGAGADLQVSGHVIFNTNNSYVGFESPRITFNDDDDQLDIAGKLILPDSGYLGCVSDTTALQILPAGDVVLTDNLYTNSGLYILERAATVGAVATWGHIWVKNEDPNTLWFTDDDGTDFQLGVDQTSHADVLVDGDFASAGLMFTDGAGVYSIKTIGADVQAYHANLAAIVAGTWVGANSITTLGTIATGTWEATDVAILHGGTGQSTAQAAINALTAVAGATNEHVLTKDTVTGNAIWKAATGGSDAFTVKVDAGATAGYIGAASNDGVLRTDAGLSYADGGDYVTLGLDVSGLTELAAAPDQGSDFVLIYDTDAAAHKKIKPTNLGCRFVARENPADYDYEVGDFTTNANYHDLDLSSIVTDASAKAVLLHLYGMDDHPDYQVRLRKNGDTYHRNIGRILTQVANVGVSADVIIPIDSTRIIEYWATNEAWTRIQIHVKGWWL